LPVSPRIIMKAALQMGLDQMRWLALYRLGLASGHYRRVTPPRPYPSLSCPPVTILSIPQPPYSVDIKNAEEVCQGLYRPFGGDPAPLRMDSEPFTHHWTDYETGKVDWGVPDVKYLWEPARFGWALILARAYALTGDNGYAQIFWRLTESFFTTNPLNLGPNWASAQEVALRLISLTICAQLFQPAPASSPERMAQLQGILASHAHRIPATLPYARAQNNNHLLSEAAGLYTAGCTLKDHPQAESWRNLGWCLFTQTLVKQIGEDGAYLQHSTNYHRLMLHLALWVQAVARSQGQSLPSDLLPLLASATHWLAEQVDPVSGNASNLGHNDGSNLLNLTDLSYSDYRPTLQAASVAFLNQRTLPPGVWDELTLWLGFSLPDSISPAGNSLFRLNSRDGASWASLRCAHFTSRPAHADQLNVDLWHQGRNIALDPGTFHYNLPPPWDNSLAHTSVHNTVTVDDQDQMTRAGRFLWLDWAQAKRISYPEPSSIIAEHDGYRKLGIIHRRMLQHIPPNGWLVTDWLLPSRQPVQTRRIILHWLLPDLPWELTGDLLSLDHGQIKLQIEVTDNTQKPAIQLIRAGEILYGSGNIPAILGWYSPTYGVKQPALSLRVILDAPPPINFSTHFYLKP
jgi:hypothetical protein